MHRPGQLAGGMARIRLGQINAAKLVQLHVAHAASEIVSDVAEQAGEKRCAHRSLLRGERIRDAHRFLRRHHRQVLLGHEAVVHRLVEPVSGERGARLGGDPPLRGDGRCLAHAGGVQLDRDGVVTAQPGDLLDAIDLACQVPPPGRNAPTPVTNRHEPQGAQPAIDLRLPDRDSENRRDAPGPHHHLHRLAGRRVHVDRTGQEAASGELNDQLRAAIRRALGATLVHSPLEAVRGLGA